ncbi:MAG TPA: MFS transporter, partial [Planctomycetota bacterium]|nr:MFS transporter [Planctomycetota bacterium]
RTRGLFFIGAAVALVGVTMAMQMGLNANFLSEDIGINGRQIGMLEAARESCGILALAVLAVLAGFAEPLVGAAMLLLVGTGLGAYVFVHSFTWVLLMSLVWSQGLHVWMPLPNSMAISLAEPGRTGHRLGQIQAAGAAGFAGGLVLALALTMLGDVMRALHMAALLVPAGGFATGEGILPGVIDTLGKISMRTTYLLAGGAAVLAAAACVAIPRRIKTPGPRLVFRRRYGLYYVLCLLEGWRKQIFICFAGFLLVNVFHTPLWVMLLLMIGVQATGYVTSPAVGRLIDRIGERPVLIFYYSCLTLFFVGYAVVPNRGVLYGIYVIDNAFFVFAMSLTTYVSRIAPQKELTPTLSMGVAMNHVAAVAMPFVGGILWGKFGYRWTFFIGAAAALLSVGVTLRVPRRAPVAVAAVADVAAEG